jgi:co-chaperonin GroES (HSP10)
LHDWILVKMDPVQKQVGSIFLPEGVDYRTATVLCAGPGKERPTGQREPIEVAAGDRLIFHRAHAEHGQGRAMVTELGDDQVLIKPRDVLVVFEGELQAS